MKYVKFYDKFLIIKSGTHNVSKIGRLKMNFLRITLKFQVVCWDIYYFYERFRCQLFNGPQKFTGLALHKDLESNKVFKAVGTVSKNGFSQKALYRLFSKLHFFHVGEVPNTSQQKSHMYDLMRNFRSKKHCGRG
jgi:hypothetical protein